MTRVSHLPPIARSAPVYRASHFTCDLIASRDNGDRVHSFSSSDADMILGANDHTMFRIHSWTLKTISGWFRSLFSMPRQNPPPRHQSKRGLTYTRESGSAVCQSIHSRRLTRFPTSKSMKQSPRYPRLRTIDPSAPSKHFADLISKLPRKHSSLIFQLRTGHVLLNKHLHRISKSPALICPACRQKEESVHYRDFILECSAYTRHRNSFRASLCRKTYPQHVHCQNQEIRIPLPRREPPS